MHRRRFLAGLTGFIAAAPALVRADSLMALSPLRSTFTSDGLHPTQAGIDALDYLAFDIVGSDGRILGSGTLADGATLSAPIALARPIGPGDTFTVEWGAGARQSMRGSHRQITAMSIQAPVWRV